MRAAFVWHSHAPDSAALHLSVRAARTTCWMPGDSIHVFEERNAPITEPHRTAILLHGAVFHQRDAMNNLCAPGAPAAVLRHFAAALGDADAAWKLDSDCLLLRPTFRTLMARNGAPLLGAEWHLKGVPVVRGSLSYLISRSAIEKCLPHAATMRGKGEDSEIPMLVRRIAGEPHLLPYDPNGPWAGWQYAKNPTFAKYAHFSVIGFGNKPVDRRRRDAAMAACWRSFLSPTK